MHRIKRRHKKSKLLIISCSVLFLFFISSGYALLNEKLNINGLASIGYASSSCNSGVTASYVNDNSWNSGNGKKSYHVVFTVNNKGKTDIDDWVIEIKGPEDLSVQTNAEVTSLDDGVLSLKPLSWNSYISVNNSLILDMILITCEDNFEPTWIKFNNCVVYGKDDGSLDYYDTTLSNLKVLPSTHSMSVDETLAMQAVLIPSTAIANVSWRSTNENVAIVDANGLVKAVGVGYAQIIASSGDISGSSEITVYENNNNSISNDVDVIFAVNSSWGSSIQFKITVTNNSSQDINHCSFNLGLPSGSKYQFWSSNISISSNTLTSNNKISSGGTFDIYGQVDLESVYNASDYTNPKILNIYAE